MHHLNVVKLTPITKIYINQDNIVYLDYLVIVAVYGRIEAVLNPDFAVENVARAKNQSETRSWNDFDPEAYHKYVEDRNRETSVAAKVFSPQ